MQQFIKSVVCPVALWLCGATAASVAVILCTIGTVQAASPLTRAVISYPNANVASRSFTQKNPETLENIMKALIEGLTFVLAPGNKSLVIKTLMNRFKISDASLVEPEYADAMKDLEPKPYPAAEGVRNMQRLMQVQNPRLANINPASLIDSSFVRKAG